MTYSPKYVFRDGVEPLAYQVFSSENETSKIVHADCAKNARECEFPLYEDDLAHARCADDLYCPNCGRVVVLAQKGNWNGWHAWLDMLKRAT